MAAKNFNEWWKEKEKIYGEELKIMDALAPGFIRRFTMGAWYDGRAEYVFSWMEERIAGQDTK